MCRSLQQAPLLLKKHAISCMLLSVCKVLLAPSCSPFGTKLLKCAKAAATTCAYTIVSGHDAATGASAVPKITCIAMILLQPSHPSNVSNAGHDVIWQGTVLDSKHSNCCGKSFVVVG